MRENLKIAKEYLSQAYKSSKEIDYLTQEMYRLELIAISIKGIDYSERVQTSPSNSLADTVEKIEMARKCLEAKISDFLLLIDNIKGTIEKVENRSVYGVLRSRYILFKKWDEISQELGYCIQHVHKLHKRGLVEVCKIIKSGD